MPRVIDVARWPRRHSYEFFRGHGQPFFSLCVRVDVAPALRRAQRVEGATPMLSYHHALLMAVNGLDCLRQRIVGDQVLEFERINLSTTVLRADETLAFADLRHDPDFEHFVRSGLECLAAARSSPSDAMAHTEVRQDVVHTTVIPWLSFSSFSHPRLGGRSDSIPKFAIGRFEPDLNGSQLWMPVQLEVHHALMDGLHAARFFEALQDQLASA